SIMLHARTAETIRYSMVYLPEEGPEGTWLEVRGDRIVLGPDDHSRPARTVLDALPPMAVDQPRNSRRILVSGFRGCDAERTTAGASTFARCGATSGPTCSGFRESSRAPPTAGWSRPSSTWRAAGAPTATLVKS